MANNAEQALASMQELEGGANRKPRRRSNGRTLLAQISGTGSERGDRQGDPGDKRKNQEPREASPSRRVAGSGGPVYRSFGHWNRRFGPRPPICGESLGASKPRQARRPFLRQHRSRRDRPDPCRNRAEAFHDPCPRHFQIGRYPRDEERNAGGRKRVFGQWIGFRQTSDCDYRRRQQAAQTRHREWLVGFPPDVGLGRWQNK